MTQKIAIINGPNLNLLGTRETNIYGDSSFETYLEQLRKQYPQLVIEYFQSNIEGEIVNAIEQFGSQKVPIILNAAAYTHTSVAIGDAVKAVDAQVIEVHISNIASRESFRQINYISACCIGTITGLGLEGYNLALSYFLNSKYQ